MLALRLAFRRVGDRIPQDATVEVRSDGRSLGLFACRPLSTGDVVLPLRGEVVGRPSRYSIQIGVDRHLEAAGDTAGREWRFLNHGCAPSAEVRVEDLTLRAARDLEAGDELTYDYLTTEAELAEPFRCRCGADGCYGEVRGFVHLSPERRTVLLQRAAPHLRALAPSGAAVR